MAMEIERKYLIELPAEEVFVRHDAACWDIVQTYLKSEAGVTARVRQVREEEQVRCYHTEKRRVSDLSAEEIEREIHAEEYETLLQRADTALKPIHKRRWRLPYDEHVLEVDVYPFWKKTAVLEIELDSENDTAEIPAWIRVLKEVTGDVRFKNVSLAREVPVEDTLLS